MTHAAARLLRQLEAGSTGPLERFTRCADDGGAAAASAWRIVRTAADAVNAVLYNATLYGTGAGVAHLRRLGYKCNPAAARTDGTYGAATAACPPLSASIDALNDASRRFPHTVAASADFATAYAQYRCVRAMPQRSRTACA